LSQQQSDCDFAHRLYEDTVAYVRDNEGRRPKMAATKRCCDAVVCVFGPAAAILLPVGALSGVAHLTSAVHPLGLAMAVLPGAAIGLYAMMRAVRKGSQAGAELGVLKHMAEKEVPAAEKRVQDAEKILHLKEKNVQDAEAELTQFQAQEIQDMAHAMSEPTLGEIHQEGDVTCIGGVRIRRRIENTARYQGPF
jgi:hypothetical protein